MIRASVGWDVDEKELGLSGERISNIERMFNVKTGLRRADDTLPRRLLEQPLIDGPSEGGVLGADFDLMVDELYETCGWDKSTGVPTPGKLNELGLKRIIEG
jgi:aldehyde:ferredoxin oxidoreductase